MTKKKAPPILAVTDLKRHYQIDNGLLRGKSVLKALDGVDFAVWPGKTLAIVGESGCGKSTLARLVAMIEPPTEGEVMINGKTTDQQLADHRRQVQIVFQNPYGSLNPRHKIGRILEEPLLLNTSMSAAERREMALTMMERVSLRPENINRYPHMFSGGQRQRIAIARAMMLNPQVVVLDEPVSALDVSIQAQVLNILQDLQDRFGLSYLFISHDLSVVRHIADDVLVMYLGRVVEAGPVKDIFSRPRHPYTAALLSATPVADPTAKKTRITLQGELPSPLNPPKGCAFHPRCAHASAKCRETQPVLEPAGKGRVACFNPLIKRTAERSS